MARDQPDAVDVVGVRAFEQVQQDLFFFLAVGDDELAAIVVVHAACLAIGIQRAIAGHAEARLETARRVVEPGVDDAAVARRGDGAGVGFGLEQQHFAARQRQRARDRESDDACANDHAFDLIRHVPNLLTELFPAQDFARIHDAVRVEGLLDACA